MSNRPKPYAKHNEKRVLYDTIEASFFATKHDTAIPAGRHRTDKAARRTRRGRHSGTWKMPDILADYREWRDQQAARVSTHSAGCHMWHERCMIDRLADALERARLADAEREAIERAADVIDSKTCGDPATLRGLLERTR